VEVGIAYDLRSAHAATVTGPEDRLEEYDGEGTVQAIAAVIEKLGHKPRPLGGGRGFVAEVLERAPDLVFNFAEGFGTRSREAHVPSVLEMLRVPFTHSDPLTLAVSLDKGICKRLVASAGVPTPRAAVVRSPGDAAALDLAYPVIAKPLNEGSSMGIRNSSRCENVRELAAHLARILRDYEQPVLVEEFCSGPEFTVGILGTGPKARVIGVMEIVPTKAGVSTFVYSLEVKRDWENQVRYEVPPKRAAAQIEEVAKVALDAYRALDCRDVGRVDVRTDGRGRPMFLEVNPLPGLDPYKSDIVILARGMGTSYDALVGGIIDSACERYGLR
jgi:D-alanine-D-alanine ligase